ncbi:MAG: phosphoenolpyruvate--protein phosphotransferase [Ruthenibacterium sp.]
MILLHGKGVSDGIAAGKICFYKAAAQAAVRTKVTDTDAELARYHAAKEVAKTQLKELEQTALVRLGADSAALFETHALMLDDMEFVEAVTQKITTEHLNAAAAVSDAANALSAVFTALDDDYMRARAADVLDITARLLGVLNGAQSLFHTATPVILAADDLSPSETVQLDTRKILGFVTRGGSENAHTAILARTMGIPAVIGVGDALLEEYDGQNARIDGKNGTLLLLTDGEETAFADDAAEKEAQKKALDTLKGLPDCTADGRELTLFCNINAPAQAAQAMACDAAGIGLFRTEFLYLAANDYPTEDAQTAAYRDVVQTMAGKRVTLRTMDIGADKTAAYFNLPHEANPALGMRAIRLGLTRPALLLTQLRAMYRASAYGSVAILFPMITAQWEVAALKKLCVTAQNQLAAEGIPFAANVPLGAMLETPAAVLVAESLATEVDFFSVGTNDLTQYTLALDRQNDSLSQFYDAHHPALLRLLTMAADAAHAADIPICICGELASDASLLPVFLKIGITSLSVPPQKVLPLRKVLREIEGEYHAPSRDNPD